MVKLAFKRLKPLFQNSLSHLFHQIKIIIQVVYGSKPKVGDLSGSKEMTQVGSGVRLADHAATFGVYGSFIGFKFSFFDVKFAKRGEERAVSCVACGHDAVKHIDAS